MPSKDSVVPAVNSSVLSDIQSTSTTMPSASSSSSSTSVHWICDVCGINRETASVCGTCKESGVSCFDPFVETEEIKNKWTTLSSIKKALKKSKGDGSISERNRGKLFSQCGMTSLSHVKDFLRRQRLQIKGDTHLNHTSLLNAVLALCERTCFVVPTVLIKLNKIFDKKGEVYTFTAKSMLTWLKSQNCNVVIPSGMTGERKRKFIADVVKREIAQPGSQVRELKSRCSKPTSKAMAKNSSKPQKFSVKNWKPPHKPIPTMKPNETDEEKKERRLLAEKERTRAIAASSSSSSSSAGTASTELSMTLAARKRTVQQAFYPLNTTTLGGKGTAAMKKVHNYQHSVGNLANMSFLHIPLDEQGNPTGTITTNAKDINALKRIYRLIKSHEKNQGTFRYVETKEDLDNLTKRNDDTRSRKKQKVDTPVKANVSSTITDAPTIG